MYVSKYFKKEIYIMKKILALVLSMLLVASCFALVAVAEDETTAAPAEDATTEAAGEATTEADAAPANTNTLLPFNDIAKKTKVLTSPNQIRNVFFNSAWEGAKLDLIDVGDPYLTINWASYINRADLEKTDSQTYPFIVFKLKIEGYVEDFELFYCAGDVLGADQNYASTTDYPCESSGEVEYIIYDLTGDCEGNYNSFRFDPMGADEDTVIYLYEMAMFATEDEALAYAGYTDEEEDEETTEEDAGDQTTEEQTEEVTTKAPATTEKQTEAAKEEGCGGIISVGAVVAMIALGAVCIKKKD